MTVTADRSGKWRSSLVVAAVIEKVPALPALNWANDAVRTDGLSLSVTSMMVTEPPGSIVEASLGSPPFA